MTRGVDDLLNVIKWIASEQSKHQAHHSPVNPPHQRRQYHQQQGQPDDETAYHRHGKRLLHLCAHVQPQGEGHQGKDGTDGGHQLGTDAQGDGIVYRLLSRIGNDSDTRKEHFRKQVGLHPCVAVDASVTKRSS